MNKNSLIALMVYAIDRDMLSFPLESVLKAFKEDAKKCKSNYNDPNDKLLYIRGINEVDDTEFFTEYILVYAKMHIHSGVCNYGNYDKLILNCKLR